ncbi:MAG: EamA family transporter [Ruminococcaceae bacterium]|nr:EamA family transporter [Oscillospiraceae bacterium]
MDKNEKAKNGTLGSILCVLAASVCFSTGGLLVKLVPWSALAINGARNLLGAGVIGLYLLATHHKLTLGKPVYIGALSMIGLTTFFAIANKLTTAANTVVLQFTAPVFVILFMALLFHTKPKKVDILACAAVLLGVCLFFIDGLRAGNMVGNLIALLSGVCYAGVFMMNASEGSDAISSCFLGQLSAGLLFVPLCLRETDFSAGTLGAVLALGAVQMGLAYILFSIGIQRTPPVTTSLITGLEPILNPLWVALFYHETVTGLAMIGAAIVIGSIVLYNVRTARESMT